MLTGEGAAGVGAEVGAAVGAEVAAGLGAVLPLAHAAAKRAMLINANRDVRCITT